MPALYADARLVRQILINLIANSVDAVAQLDERWISVKLTVRAEHAEITVTDGGRGIEPGLAEKIMTPFFTTKSDQKGTGLGLATVFGIVKQHHGWIQVESELGKGTTFSIYLPVASSTAVAEGDAETQIRRRGGSETILVVEDERDLRDLVSRVLRNDGYRVFEAVDGQSAFKLWQQYRDQIHMVFTDVIMPGGMNGRELAEKIWKEKPGLKVIFTSGYSADVVGKDFVLQKGLNYLQKPYQPQRLATAVRDCLDARN